MSKLKFRSFIIIFFLLILVQANVHAFQITDNQTVDAHKTWTIRFTSEVGFDFSTQSGIIITDSKGNTANVSFGLARDGKSVLVYAPKDGYIPGESYTLSVNTNAHSIKGKNLKQVRSIHFKIKSNDNGIVTFPDKNLERVIRQQINKPVGDIYKSDVEKITQLDAKGKNIQAIGGIENLTNLQYLNLSSNEISDINELKGLTNLQRLDMHSTVPSSIRDNILLNTTYLQPLLSLNNLKELDLSYNYLSDLSMLKYMTNLKKLDISLNKITSIDQLKYLVKLEELYCDGFEDFVNVKNIDCISNLTNLKKLSIEGDIEDLSPLKSLANLSSLAIYRVYNHDNVKVDISVLQYLTNLKELKFQNYILENEDISKYLTNLQSLDLMYGSQNNQPTIDISSFKNLTNLERIYLDNCIIKDAISFKYLTNLQSVSIFRVSSINYDKDDILESLPKLSVFSCDSTIKVILDGNVGDDLKKVVVFPDKNLEQAVRNTINKPTGDICKLDVKNITRLDIKSKNIKDISGIENLVNLQWINLNDNQISDISPLKSLTNLTTLALSRNKINDISALKKLTNLQWLGLKSNQISNISILQELIGLKTLYLSGNKISDYGPVQGYYNNLKEKDFELGTRPKVVSVTVIDSETIRVKFNKTVNWCYARHPSNYRLLDNKNVDITNHIDEIYSTKGDRYKENSDTYDIKLKKFNPNNSSEYWGLTRSKYTLTIKNIADTESTPNVMGNYTVDLNLE